MTTTKKLMGLMVSLMCVGFANSTAKTDGKFVFDGAAAKHPLTLELESVAYKAKGMDLYFKVINNSDTAVDFTRANWKVNYGSQTAFIQESEFDGLVIQPKSKRFAHISFGTDDSIKTGFNNERANGTSTIQIENVTTVTNKKLAPITLKNY
jgi:hypothetical protein